MNQFTSAVGDEFEVLEPMLVEYPRFVHKASGIPFQLVPGGQYLMGLTAAEEHSARALSPVLQANLEEMRPVRQQTVGPLLVSSTPVLNRQRTRDVGQYRSHPAFFERSDAEQFAGALGCRLPREFEWEYLCRAGTRTLFTFGDRLLPNDELEKWLLSDFSSMERLRCNGFGLYGIFNPEWCQEKFTVNLEEGAPLLDGSYAVRGGGAYFWPWQDEEWVWCMSAMRMPSSGLENDEACVRLVRDVPNNNASS
jgi:formylglycine-generating enzyme